MTYFSRQDDWFAWIVCLCCAVNTHMCGGFIYASGIFYTTFKDAIDAPESAIAFAISINPAIMHAIGPIVGRLNELLGHRIISMAGVLISTLGLASSAFATEVYHLYLSFGILAGIGLGMMLNTGGSAISPYFKKYKRLACGLVWCGMAIGTLVFPPIIDGFNEIYGWRGTLLLLAGLNAQALISSILFRPFQSDPRVKREIAESQRNKPKNSQEAITMITTDSIAFQNEVLPDTNLDNDLDRKAVTDSHHRKRNILRTEISKVISMFKILPFTSNIMSMFLTMFPLCAVLSHFGNYALLSGYTMQNVVAMYMVFGISSLIARIITGFIGNFPSTNIPLFIMVATAAGGIVTLFVPLLYNLEFMFLFTALFSVFQAPLHTVGPSITLEYLQETQVPLGTGIFTLTSVPGFLFGAPLGELIYRSTGSYAPMFYICGGLLILAGLAFAPSAYSIQKGVHKRG